MEFDQQEMVEHGVDDLDEALVEELLKSEIVVRELDELSSELSANPTIAEKLDKLGLISNSRLLLGTFLCLSSESQLSRTFSSCGLHLVRYDGIEPGIARTDTDPFSGNLVALFSKGIQWLRDRSGLHRRGEVGDPSRDDLEIPVKVLREALANALIHRDYEDKVHRQQPTRVEVYSNRVEITSYGHLPRGLTVDALNDPKRSVRSIRNNPTVARIMLRVKHAELNAIGVRRMRAMMEMFGLPLPRYVYDADQGVLTVVLSRPSSGSDSAEDVPTRLSPERDTSLPKESKVAPGTLTAMLSSTSVDLPEHRKAVYDACVREGIVPTSMEHVAERDASSIRVSLEMVDQADIYIGIYAWRYGWVPDFDNPDRTSIVEMEFNRALKRQERGELKALLVFVMHDDHPIRASDIESGDEAQRKLREFKQRVSADRVVIQFQSSQDLRHKVIDALADLKKRIEPAVPETSPGKPTESDAIPTPPAFYAEPDYIGSHQFVGRARELEDLSDWAKPADPTNLLLFDAIGGGGKSMLTWEWTTRHATHVRDDWAGQFWYSFYERGAIMADFCQRALAYMTGRPLKELRKKKTAELREPLLAQLHAKPWLLILDGLERVLVAYHRIDAAEMPDEDANNPTDKIVSRNPTDAIRDEDNDLLRALAAAAPSKILVSSRLTPRVLLNPSGQPITGAKRITLPGLRPSDAERLLRSCGIEGDSAAIQDYLTTNCDNHPLVIGILGGLINNPGPTRGNFDAWVADPDAGARLDLFSLDLIQRRNHILRAALDDLPPASHQLLSTLAMLSESVDYETISAFNPHLPPEPEEMREPTPPEDLRQWRSLSDGDKAEWQKQYEASLARWKDYEKAMQVRVESMEYREAPNRLAETVTDLEQRGLLQYDGRTQRHDLHPVVRGVAAGAMRTEDKERYGQRVVDHFSWLPHAPYEQAETLEDLRPGLNVVRTLLKLGRFQQAADAFRGQLADALLYNVEAYWEVLSLLRPLFPGGWGELPKSVAVSDAAYLARRAAIGLASSGESSDALAAYGSALHSDLERADWKAANLVLGNISMNLCSQNLMAKALRVDTLACGLASVRDDHEDLFVSRILLYSNQSRVGQWAEAEASWQLLDPMGRNWRRSVYRPGDAEWQHAQFRYWHGTLQENHLAISERLATEGKNRIAIRHLHGMRGVWRLEQGEWELAAASFAEAVRMARESGIPDAESETGLALAKHHLGQLAEPQREAERLARLRQPAHRFLAQLWFVLDDPAQAQHHALAAYRWAWADGEPYVHRYELTKTTELLQQMNVPIPNLPPYDPAKDEPFPWEADVHAGIDKLQAERESEAIDK